MSDVIQLLPDSVANQIAAGEVIQRPASVVKELVENAVDAGASTIKVLVVDAGRTSIQVVDDGKGMSETDARLSFERHATSKIRKADDLFALHTMGFRGEALASIAAVAQVELKTRMTGSDLGSHLSLSASKVVSQEPVACPVGSNFQVENLFFNVPARRKFLKTNATELNNILTAFERIVLVYPEINFSLYSNGAELMNLRAGSLRQRIVDVFGKRLNQELLPVTVETEMCKVVGFVGKPESARKKGAHEYFFVNGRYMKHPYFHKAVMNAYDRMLPMGMQIPYFIYFEVKPEDIDVNIHPTKTEIKFENEQAIWQILTAAVKDAIGKFCEIPTIDFDIEGKPDIPVLGSLTDVEAPKAKINPSYNPFQASSGGTRSAKPLDKWEELYKGLQTGDVEPPATDLFGMSDADLIHTDLILDEQPVAGNMEPSAAVSPSEGTSDVVPSKLMTSADGSGYTEGQIVERGSVEQLSQASQEPADMAWREPVASTMAEEHSPTHYQYKGTYIMTAVKSGLMIIDQYRADVRIKYEQYLRQMSQQSPKIQQVLFPEVVQFSPSTSAMVEVILPELKRMGFDLSNLGRNSYSINGVPAGLEGLGYVELLTDMVADAVDKGRTDIDSVHHSLALTMARKAAIPHGQVLSNAEMETVVNELFTCSNVNYTPDGKAILCILPQKEIEQLMG